MSRVVTQSRPYDQVFDATYTSSSYRADPRVATLTSRPDVVAGSGRYQYFRRPIMPRMTAVPPQVLLAPTETIDPLAPVEEIEDLPMKDQQVQTQYRESEAQTNPYTPEFYVRDGTEPEILLLKDIKFGAGLPVGKKEVMMIEQARSKRDLESNLPPFTDEAGLTLRKKLMEAQEMKEFKMREGEIDAKREARIEAIDRALKDHDESNEFLAAQRVEGLRQIRMEERESKLLKIRDKRIKVLRRLAHRRNQVDPRLSSSEGPDPINHYFDKGSQEYAPIKRLGVLPHSDSTKYDVLSRTAPLTHMENINTLESNLPMSMTASGGKISSMSMTQPKKSKGPRAAEPRLTSAALRSLRNRKRDIEIMTRILTTRKLERTGAIRPDSHPASTPGSAKNRLAAMMPKGRPASPDFTQDPEDDSEEQVNVQAACVLLQRLLRGRAVQNTMFEGRFRRRELIMELRSAGEVLEMDNRGINNATTEMSTDDMNKVVKDTTIDAIAGSTSSNLIYGLVQEKERNESMEELQSQTAAMIEQRRNREAGEGGRRQKENMAMPTISNEDGEGGGDDIPSETEVRSDKFLLDARYTKQEEPVEPTDATAITAE